MYNNILCFWILALAVFTRSPAAYEALKSFKLIQLPSIRTLKYYIDANLEGAGNCMQRLEDERKHYLVMLEQRKHYLVMLEQKKVELHAQTRGDSLNKDKVIIITNSRRCPYF